MTPGRITKGTRKSARLRASNFQSVALRSIRGRVGKALEVCVNSAQEDPTAVVMVEDGEASPTQRRDFVGEHVQLQYGWSPRWASCCVALVERADKSGKIKDNNE